MATAESLAELLDALEDRLPKMIEDSPSHGDFWREFAGEADAIEDQAGKHCELVTRRVSQMLAKHGRYIATVGADDT